MLVALEHAPQEKRGLAASFANSGNPAGAVTATLAMGAVSMLPRDDFLSWGWRIPFLFSVVLIVIGMFIRLKVSETPMFQALDKAGQKKKSPLLQVIHSHPRAILIALLAGISFYASQGVLTVWGVAAAVEHGVSQSGVLGMKALGPGIAVAAAITIEGTAASASATIRTSSATV